MKNAATQMKLKEPPVSLGRDTNSAAMRAVAGGELDELKFRIIRRGQRHFFRDVRFRDDEEGRQIARFLEGQALEQLSPDKLRTTFGTSSIVTSLQSLLGDLKSVFC